MRWSAFLLTAALVAPHGALAKKKPHVPPQHKAAPGKGVNAAPAAKPTPAAQKVESEKVEEIEEVETVDPTDAKPVGVQASGTPPTLRGESDAGSAADDSKPKGLVAIMARLHPAVVHLPVAWVMLWLFCEAATWLLRREELVAAGLYLSGLACLSFVPAAITGLLRISELPQDPEAIAGAILHRNIMYGCAAASVLAAAYRWRTRLAGPGPWRIAYVLWLLCVCATVGFGAHLGGKLVYGDDYLPF